MLLLVPLSLGLAGRGIVMRPTTHPRGLEALSDLIGAIYDCVVEPSRWEQALDRVRRLLECKNCVLSATDMTRGDVRARITIGVPPSWRQRMSGYGTEIAELYRAVPDLLTRPLAEPFVLRRDVPEAVLHANRYYREWAVPNDMVDVIQIFLMRNARRNAALAFGRHRKVGLITEREIRLMRLIAPHIRRAVTISGLIDVQGLRAGALDATLDALRTGVVIVARDGAILHANQSARRLLDKGDVLRAQAGKMRSRDQATSARLTRAFAGTDDDLGVPLRGASGAIATAHIMPLGRGPVLPGLVPRAAAAVFVATDAPATPDRLRPVAEAFGLTPGELRLLERLVTGDSLGEAAAALGVARTTAKTHLSRILAKTGTRRQTGLLALMHRLVPAVGTPAADGPEARRLPRD